MGLSSAEVGPLAAQARRQKAFVAVPFTYRRPAWVQKVRELEGSGADPTQSMVDMMASMRAYESGQKVIQTIDETLGKAASAVGSPHT